MADENNTDITALTVQLLSAFVSKNSVPSESLAELIKTTRAALTEDLAAPARDVAPDHVPAVSVRKSIASPDHIISLIDGKPYKTPEQYRERYKLPKSYPLVAPNYSDARRAVAERLGLGRKTAAGPATATAPSPPPPAPAAKSIVAPTPAKADAPKAAKRPAAAKAEAAPTPKANVSAKSNKAEVKAQPRKRLSIFSAKEKPAPSAMKADADRSGASKAKSIKAAAPKAEVAKPKAAPKPTTKSKEAKSIDAAAASVNAAPAAR